MPSCPAPEGGGAGLQHTPRGRGATSSGRVSSLVCRCHLQSPGAPEGPAVLASPVPSPTASFRCSGSAALESGTGAPQRPSVAIATR